MRRIVLGRAVLDVPSLFDELIGIVEYPEPPADRTVAPLSRHPTTRHTPSPVKPAGDEGGVGGVDVNDIVKHCPGRGLHFYSNEHRWMANWINARRELMLRKFGPIQYTHSCRTGGQYSWPWPGHGTSALGAVYTGLAMGYDRIVLAGVPLDDAGHSLYPPW